MRVHLTSEIAEGGEGRAGYGKYLLKELSKRLTIELGPGFDESNLRNIRSFYQAFPIRDALRHELTWTHYRILSRVENELARNFYILEAIDCQWDTRLLQRQVNTLYYERILSSQQRKELREEENAGKSRCKQKISLKTPIFLTSWG